jgi:four helix bundle protein
VFELSRKFPPEERYSLTDQSVRSSRSVSGAIAEAWRRRRYPQHWISKLTEAESEAAETQVWMETALQCGYITPVEFDEIFAAYEIVLGQLVLMAANAQKWATP